MGRQDYETETLIAHTIRGEGFDASGQCAVDGCEAKRHASGFCRQHYARFKRHGNPLAGRVAEGEPLAFLIGQIGTQQDDCITWPYGMLATGYGSIEFESKTQRAHRVMCAMAHGEPPSDGLDAAHSCGVRACINPKHLRWANRSENMADAVDHGTAPRGERHGGSKINESIVLKIVERLESGETHQAIADDVGISRNTVTDIAKGKNWAWLTGRGTPIIPVCYDDPRRFTDIHGGGEHGDLHPTLESTNPKQILAFPERMSGTQYASTEDLAPSMGALNPTAIAIQAGALRENPTSGPDGVGVQEGLAYTIEARAEVQAVAFAQNQRNEVREMNVAGALAAEPGMKQQTYVNTGWQVRRLTPTEAERLQGFPDGFTAITYRGKPAADGPRYKALGNSWAVPVGAWITGRIATATRPAS